MKTIAPLALATALCSFASLPAQSFVLIIRTGPSDLVVNASLVEAIAQESPVQTGLRQRLGKQLQVWRGVSVAETAAHRTGIHQLHVELDMDVADSLSPENLDANIDLVTNHVSKRLDELLFTQPRHKAESRRKELTEHLGRLLAQQEDVTLEADLVEQEVRHLNTTAERLYEQFAETRLDVATEERAVEHLEAMRNECQMRRDKLQLEQAAIGAMRAHIANDLESIQSHLEHSQVTGSAAEQEKLQEKLRALNDELTRITDKSRTVEAKVLDARQMYSSILEELPAASLALQRSSARLQKMKSEQQTFGKRRAAADDQRRKALATRIMSESLRIDIVVCKELLTETSARLARLEPVRIEVIRPR